MVACKEKLEGVTTEYTNHIEKPILIKITSTILRPT